MYNELGKVAHKWKDIGFQIKIQPHILDQIQHDHIYRGTKECFREMLKWWLHTSTKKAVENWRTICNALLKLNENGLAREVAQKYGMHLVLVCCCDVYAKHNCTCTVYN